MNITPAELPFCPTFISTLSEVGGEPIKDWNTTLLNLKHNHLIPGAQQQLKQHTCSGLELSMVKDH